MEIVYKTPAVDVPIWLRKPGVVERAVAYVIKDGPVYRVVCNLVPGPRDEDEGRELLSLIPTTQTFNKQATAIWKARNMVGNVGSWQEYD